MSMHRVLQMLADYPHADDPHGQLDRSVADRCKVLAAKPDLSAEDLEPLLKDCVQYSLCSDFVVSALNAIWATLKKHPAPEGK